MQYIVIMAGGSGTRLWPMSRKSKPKQLQNLVSEKSLIQETYERVTRLVPNERIFISTTPNYVEEIKRQLPKIPEKNYIVEPATRNTMASLGYILLAIKMVDPKATIAAIPSDHLVKNTEAFVQVFKAAFTAAEKYKDKIVTVGINPTKPETGLGYIKMGKPKPDIGGEKLFAIDKFEEKPNLATAQKYLQSWEYLWNTAYYFVTLDGAMKWIKAKRPKLAKVLQQLEKVMKETKGENGAKAKIAEIYNTIDEEQVANVVAEDASTTLVVPADMDWSDIGDWGALHDVLSDSFSSSIISRGHHIDHNSENCLVYAGNKMIATLGLKDIIVIDSTDVLLVANKNRTQEVKQLIDRLKSEGRHLYL